MNQKSMKIPRGLTDYVSHHICYRESFYTGFKFSSLEYPLLYEKCLEKPLKDVTAKMSSLPEIWGTRAGRHPSQQEWHCWAFGRQGCFKPAATQENASWSCQTPFSQQRRYDTGATRDGPSDIKTGLARLSVGQQVTGQRGQEWPAKMSFKKSCVWSHAYNTCL